MTTADGRGGMVRDKARPGLEEAGPPTRALQPAGVQPKVSDRAFSTMILRWSSSENDATLAKKSRGWGSPSACGQSEPNRIRPHRQVAGQVVDVVLDEGCHPAVLDELLDRIGGEHAGVLPAQHVQRMQQAWDPVRSVLDVRHAQPGEALEQLVGDQHRGEVLDQTVLHELGDQRGRLYGGRVRTTLTIGRGGQTPGRRDVRRDVGVAVLEARVRGDDDARLLDPGPEGVEGGVGR